MAARFKQIIVAIVAIIGMLLAAFLKGRSSGVESEKEKARDSQLADRKESQEIVNEVTKDVAGSSDSSIDDKLHDWVRR